jgi:hypothetical protein
MFNAEDYYQTIRSVRPAVVSLTGQPWDIPEKFAQKLPPTGYEFMIYLRHHGFPSPLLDWTRSPFVAAFSPFIHERANMAVKLSFTLMSSGQGAREVFGANRQSFMD